MIASQKGHLDMVRMLLGAGSSMHRQDKRLGATPLVFAVAWNQIAMVKLLLDMAAPTST